MAPKHKKTTIAPGPSGHPIIGNLSTVRGNQLQHFLQLRQEYGNLVRLAVGPRTLHLVSRPDMVKHILQDNNRNYTKGRILDKAKQILGEGLLTSEGETWRRQRRLAQPAFHRRKIAGFAQTMINTTAEMLSRWSSLAGQNQPLDVAGEMMRLTLTLVTRTLFGTALSPAELETVASVMPFILRETDRRMASALNLREWLPIPAKRRYRQSLARLDQIVYRIIEARRLSREERPDLLGMLMATRDIETGQQMSARQLRDEVMTIFLAGHETTANHLAWTFYLLSKYPPVRQQLQAEIDATLAGRQPAAADFRHLPYTRLVLNESLRLYPPAWAFGRQAIEADEIGGYHIPAGSGIIISPYIVHRHPAFWPNPEGFDPQRFAPPQAKQRPRYAYIPFGGGPRLCIGNNFAHMEATLILAMVTQQFELDLVPAHEVVAETAVVLRPQNGILVTCHSR